MRKERYLLIIAAFFLIGLALNQGFTLLAPLPDTPEMARAKAEISILKAKSDIEGQSLYRIVLVGSAVFVAGIAVVFGAFIAALLMIKTIALHLVNPGELQNGQKALPQ